MPVVLVAVTHSSYWAFGTRSLTVQCVSFTCILLTERQVHISFTMTSQQEANRILTVVGVIIQRAESHLVARRYRLPVCPPARVCSRARSTPPCRRRTGSNTHAGTSAWLSWQSGDWSLGRMELLQRVEFIRHPLQCFPYSPLKLYLLVTQLFSGHCPM